MLRRQWMGIVTFVSMNRTITLLSTAFTLIATLSVGQWQPYNTGLNAVRSVTTQDGAIYLASYPNGVFKSTNDGGSWTDVNSGLPVSGSSIFARSVGSNATHLFAGTHSGIYRSANGGTSWEAANGSLTASNQVYANKFFRFGNTTFAVFTGSVGTGGGVYRTVDNGSTWLIGHSGMGSNATVYQLASSGSALYAATNVGLYKSTDNGQQWSAIPNSNFAIYAVQFAGGRLHIISTFGYRYSTTDGASWTNSTGGPANPSRGELIAFDGKLYAITGTNSGVLRSLDNGASYSAYNDGLTPIDAVAQEQFHASGNTLYMGAFSDLYSITGSSVGLGEMDGNDRVAVYPTVFQEGFTVDLEMLEQPASLVMTDASGRTVFRADVRNERTFVPRTGLAAGAYRLLILDSRTGTVLQRGAVIAE